MVIVLTCLQLTLIATDLDGVAARTWVPNCMILVQAVFCNILSSASDLFQARKTLLVTCTTIAFVGAAIAPGSKTIGRLIAAQTLIGFSLAIIPLTFAVPSEILPKRWRPSKFTAYGSDKGQKLIQFFSSGTGGNQYRRFPGNDFRTHHHRSTRKARCVERLAEFLCKSWLRCVYLPVGLSRLQWIETALWGASAVFLFIGYRPPKRHTRLDHLSAWQKIKQLDLVGALLLATGLTLFLTGLNVSILLLPNLTSISVGFTLLRVGFLLTGHV